MDYPIPAFLGERFLRLVRPAGLEPTAASSSRYDLQSRRVYQFHHGHCGLLAIYEDVCGIILLPGFSVERGIFYGTERERKYSQKTSGHQTASGVLL